MVSGYYLLIARFLFVVFVLIIFNRIRKMMLRQFRSNKVLAVLEIDGGHINLPVYHHEATIGRSKSCDVVIPLVIISRQHAVLTMDDDGTWRIADTKSKSGILINGKEFDKNTVIEYEDKIDLAGINIVLKSADGYSHKDFYKYKKSKLVKMFKEIFEKFKSKNPKPISPVSTLVMLNIFQAFAMFKAYSSVDDKYYMHLLISFCVVFAMPWISLGISKSLGIINTGTQTAAFFLSTMGLSIIASTSPSGLLKQTGAFVLGVFLFFTLCWVLKNLKLVMKLRPYVGILSLLILGANILLGSTINGQANWIRLGGISIQPSEFVKILFIFTGAATLEWLLTAKNLIILTLYSISCMGCLFLMGDFGTASIFFIAFLVLVFLTSGDIRAIILSCVSAALGGVMLLNFKPYVVQRFSAWGNVWNPLNVNASGYQQTRALMAIASGGLLGLGSGNGFLRSVFAADTDLVFGIICEEWGLLIAFAVAGCYVLFLIASMRCYKSTRSSYYVIAACTAATVFLFQSSLNIFGTVDILPLTGVTLPFISNGGSSMAASWGLLSFISAALNYKKAIIS